MNDNIDVKEKMQSGKNTVKISASSFASMLENNKMYRGIYGLILTDIPAVQIVNPFRGYSLSLQRKIECCISGQKRSMIQKVLCTSQLRKMEFAI